jgi:hypothetical protein
LVIDPSRVGLPVVRGSGGVAPGYFMHPLRGSIEPLANAGFFRSLFSS